MSNREILEQFYTAFSNGDSDEMVSHYHEDIVFHDPAFGELKGERACKMWEMLLSRSDGNIKIQFTIVDVNDQQGKVEWVAEYFYGKKKRKVINKVSSTLLFDNGKIIQHTDSFDLWSWTKQALGIPGYLLGWTSFMRNKIQSMTKVRLDEYLKGK